MYYWLYQSTEAFAPLINLMSQNNMTTSYYLLMLRSSNDKVCVLPVVIEL